MEGFVTSTCIGAVVRRAEGHHAFGMGQSYPRQLSKTLADLSLHHIYRYSSLFQAPLHRFHVVDDPQWPTVRRASRMKLKKRLNTVHRCRIKLQQHDSTMFKWHFFFPNLRQESYHCWSGRSVTGDLSLAAPVPERSVTGAGSNHGSRRFPISEIFEGQAFLFYENVCVCVCCDSGSHPKCS